jgi:hypothetical protein
MWKLLQYYGKVQSTRGALGSLPGWARLILLIVALPGIVGLLLSALAICVSLAALFLLTVPAYRLLSMLTGSGGGGGQEELSSSSEFMPATGPVADFVEPESVEVHDADEPGDRGDRGIGVPATVMDSRPAADASQRPRRQIDVRIVE